MSTRARSLGASLALALIAAPIVLSLAPSAAAATCGPGSDLAHWWSADGHTVDSAGSADAVLQGGATFIPGAVAEAFGLDGIDDWVDLPGAAVPPTSDFTIDGWFHWDTLAGEQIVFEKYVEGSPASGFTLTKLNGNSLLLWIGGTVFNAGAPIGAGWHHLALVRSGNTFTLYFDGSVLTSGSSAADLTSPASLKLGHRGAPGDTPGSTDTRGFFMDGGADDVGVYHRALTAGEIAGIHGNGAGGRCPGIADPPQPAPELAAILFVAVGLVGLGAIAMRRR